ncbi:D-alanyl-D-alanine carboxypeptidase/D-alanyl-D-alanine-endopeptidase [Streptomyces sp. GC420]|uniref:D-alanyl-D-alanine carboxypeptidase/D-alanyl-D-alanine endopeptidase n=1 Tax=Streptomyces sp. GC420 TaxID=2697568 RepID=UPI001D82B8B4|nr:D-alanyl-D-alanine carboxypeptidase/D-alanyl-D-alanine-endopeptidase [Streptomyces sp. GC420]NBM19238.1 D-alanyl-D-alanine carboxypeptidase/D-alanyl-D-alanine-endopeptidase [Streptomyces sp. GC420]
MPELKTWQLTAVSAVAGCVLATVAVAAAGPWDSGQRKAERDRAGVADHTGGTHHGKPRRKAPEAAPSAPAVLSALGERPAAADPDGSGGGAANAGVPLPTRRGLAEALGPLLEDPALGADASAAVLDAATGERLYGARAADALVPASTIKIATAAAALASLGPGHRIDTTVVADDGTTVLVGGGDPTLTEDALAKLADGTAAALKKRGADKTELRYDTSLYSGPDIHPIGAGNANIARITPLMVDEGRLDESARGPAPRTGDPAGDAARAFAGLLEDRGIDAGDPSPGAAGEDVTTLAKVSSAPLSALVERMLTNSDNDIAEALARQTALAAGEPASFEGAARAVGAAIGRLGADTGGSRFADGSGLSREDRLSASLLARILVRATDPAHPELRPVITGLPVAGFSGTLQGRYEPGSAGTGMVRAKTGTLSGVNALAGTVVSADGRLLAFAFLTNGTTDAVAAQAALDRLASALANCGCR